VLALNAIRLLHELFQAGAFPRNFAALNTEDVNTWVQQGRAAVSLQSMGRNRVYNDPQKSKFPGRIMTGAVPISASLKEEAESALLGMKTPEVAMRSVVERVKPLLPT